LPLLAERRLPELVYRPDRYANAAQTQLARNQFAFQDKASLFQVDNQAEARFFDGLFGHTVIFGVDYKNYLLK
ncbi:hypothetical protein, partial [Acinetobacter baumannii]|uniref:hypothetical protein n=1 Tax=Acinetobacter baumannii TaxID=470 RepID=UPI001C083088